VQRREDSLSAGSTQLLLRKYTGSALIVLCTFMIHPKPSKLHIFIKIKSLWMWQHLWGHSSIILDIFDFGGCSRTRVIILSVLSLGPQFPNIQYFDVCECLRAYIMLFGSISPVRQYWKYPFFRCPTMEADMEALGASHSLCLQSHVSRFHA